MEDRNNNFDDELSLDDLENVRAGLTGQAREDLMLDLVNNHRREEIDRLKAEREKLLEQQEVSQRRGR